MTHVYESPEVIELGDAADLIMGCNCYNCDCDYTDRDSDTGGGGDIEMQSY